MLRGLTARQQPLEHRTETRGLVGPQPALLVDDKGHGTIDVPTDDAAVDRRHAPQDVGERRNAKPLGTTDDLPDLLGLLGGDVRSETEQLVRCRTSLQGHRAVPLSHEGLTGLQLQCLCHPAQFGGRAAMHVRVEAGLNAEVASALLVPALIERLEARILAVLVHQKGTVEGVRPVAPQSGLVREVERDDDRATRHAPVAGAHDESVDRPESVALPVLDLVEVKANPLLRDKLPVLAAAERKQIGCHRQASF